MPYLDRPFEIKSTKSDGTFSGYGSVFGELDSYRDIVMPGAFAKSLADDFAAKKRKVPMLWQHNSRVPIGVYTTIREDDIGLYLEGECNMEVQQGREAHSLMKQGALTGLSIGYNTITQVWDEQNNLRKLLQVQLWEVSPVTFPAGDNARVQTVKSIEDLATLSDVEDLLRDAHGFSRKEAVAFIARIKAIAPQRDSEPGAESLQKTLNILRSINSKG